MAPLNALSEYNEGAQNRKKGTIGFNRAYQNSIGLDPTFARAPNNLAWLYATCGEPKVRSGSKGHSIRDHRLQHFQMALLELYRYALRWICRGR